jgi:hypothetical protein
VPFAEDKLAVVEITLKEYSGALCIVIATLVHAEEVGGGNLVRLHADLFAHVYLAPWHHADPDVPRQNLR